MMFRKVDPFPASSRRRLRALGALALGAAALAAPGQADARGRIPVLVQVTRNTVGDVEGPKIRSQAGDSIVFVSDGDVMGPGTAPGHREVYLYDVDSGTTTRLTTTVDGESWEAARETDDIHSARPTAVPFTSTGDLDPSVGNADHNPEIFLSIPSTGQLLQVTDTVAPVANGEPFTSDSGKCMVFRSNGDLEDNDGSDPGLPTLGFHNPDGSDEVFHMTFGEGEFDIPDRRVTQVSNGPAGTTSDHPLVGGYYYPRQCRSTVWQSDYDQLGNGSSGSHIYNFTRNNAVREQLSKPGASTTRNPSISSASNFARGPFVYFESNADPIDNGSTAFEMYRFRLFKNELWQYTFADADSSHGAISDGGGRTAFQSHAELFEDGTLLSTEETPPVNPDGNEEVFMTLGKTRLVQVTRSSGCESGDVTIRDTGESIAFRSTCDLVPGSNPGAVPQVFHFVFVKSDDPLATASGCVMAEGCCNEANGCYEYLYGRRRRPPRSAILPNYGS